MPHTSPSLQQLDMPYAPGAGMKAWHDSQHIEGDYNNTEAIYCPGARPFADSYWCNKLTGNWEWQCNPATRPAFSQPLSPGFSGCSMTQHWIRNRDGKPLSAHPQRRWVVDNPANAIDWL